MPATCTAAQPSLSDTAARAYWEPLVEDCPPEQSGAVDGVVVLLPTNPPAPSFYSELSRF